MSRLPSIRGSINRFRRLTRVILAWLLNADWQYDPDFVTELDVRFIAESDGTTRVELEHRDLEKYGEKAAEIRATLDSPDGWNGTLAFYAEVAKL